MENTIYGLFQETVNKYRNDVAIIEDKRKMTFGELSDIIMLQYSVCSFDIFVEEVFTSLLNGARCPKREAKASDEGS